LPFNSNPNLELEPCSLLLRCRFEFGSRFEGTFEGKGNGGGGRGRRGWLGLDAGNRHA
jgi:hypothetical protein